MRPSTDWTYVWLLIVIGICAAMQVGKVPPALSALQSELGFDIVVGAWVVSMFSAIGAAAGCLAGWIADRFGARVTVIAGLLGMAAASAAGGVAHDAASLLVSRAVEGMAFVIVVVAIPSLLTDSAHGHDRQVVLGFWGIYMPTGMAIAFVLTPAVLASWDWRVLWQMNALLLVALAVALGMLRRAPAGSTTRGSLNPADFGRAVLRRGPLLLALTFACYTFQYLAVFGLFPTMLEEAGVSPQQAGNLTAAAAAANAVGNVVAGRLLARRVEARRLILGGSLGMAVIVVGVFLPLLSPTVRCWMAVGFAGVGGLVPASIFASVPAVAGGNSAATTMGLVMQASHMGQLLGPPVVAAVATWAGGWQISPIVLVPVALLAVLAGGLVKAGR